MDFTKKDLNYLLGALIYFTIYSIINLTLLGIVEKKSTVTQSDLDKLDKRMMIISPIVSFVITLVVILLFA